MPVQTITETITSLTLGVGGVVGTSLENVVVAVAVFCGRIPVAVLGAGFFLGLAALLALSWLTAMAIGLLPIEYLGIFGVLPIVLGLRELLRGGQEQLGAPRTANRGAVASSLIGW